MTEFEKLEAECQVEQLEKKARMEEAMLSEIEEGHESQVSESESCETLSDAGKRSDDEDDDYDDRLFEIDAIIREAQKNVEELHHDGVSLHDIAGGGVPAEDRTPSVEPDDSLEERVTKQVRTCITQQQPPRTISQDSLDRKTSQGDPMATSVDSLDFKQSKDPMTTSIDSLDDYRRAQERKDLMVTSIDSLDSGRDADISSGSERPPFGGGIMEWSTDSLEPGNSLPTHATYQLTGTDSMLTGSYTSASNTLVPSIESSMTASMYLPEGELPPDPTGFDFRGPQGHVTETVEESQEPGFSKVIRRTVTLPPEVKQVSFAGPDAQRKMSEYIDQFSVC